MGDKKYKQFVYSVNRYGEELAKKIADKSFNDKIKYQDYFEIKDNIAIFYVYTKAYGIINVLIDKEDLDKVIPYKLNISNDHHAKTYYCKVINGVGLHRILTGAIDGEVVDHINRDGLDNRKSNLRRVDVSTNNRNANIRCDNSSVVRGIMYEVGLRYRAFWYNLNGKKESKSFSIAKYGEKEALRLDYNYRLAIEKEYNYI